MAERGGGTLGTETCGGSQLSPSNWPWQAWKSTREFVPLLKWASASAAVTVMRLLTSYKHARMTYVAAWHSAQLAD